LASASALRFASAALWLFRHQLWLLHQHLP
jgi:hypothetical protein